MATRKLKPVRLPAIYLWAAGQKALLEGRYEDSLNIQKLFTESTRYCQSEDYRRAEREKTIRGEIRSKKNKGLIPFERNEIDLALATVVFGLGGEFKVYSERSYVPSGFLRFRKTDLIYIEKVSQIIREDSRNPELLNDSDKKLVINFLDGLSTQNVFYKTVNDGANVLKISGEFEIFSSLPKSFECLISLCNEPEKDTDGILLNSGTFNRRLGKGSLSTNDTQELLLTVVSAQTQLELTEMYCFPIQKKYKPKKNIASTRSFGKDVQDFDQLGEAMYTYIKNGVKKLSQNKLFANKVTIFVSGNYHKGDKYHYSKTIKFQTPTRDPDIIWSQIHEQYKVLCNRSEKYKKCGIIFNELTPDTIIQTSLFNDEVKVFDSPQNETHEWEMRQDYITQKYTTSWDELPYVFV